MNFGGNTPTDGNTYNSIVALFNSNYDTLSTTIYKIPNTNSGTFCGFFPILNSKQKLHYWGVINNSGNIPFSGMNFLFAHANQSNYTLNTHRVYHSIHYHRPNYATQFINDSVLVTSHIFKLSHPNPSIPYCTSVWWLNAKTFDTLSQKIYGSPNADFTATSIIPLANKDVLVSGVTDTLNVFSDPMLFDAFLMRLDSAGNVKFCKSIGTQGHDNMYLTKVGQKYYYIGSSFNGVAPTSSLSVLYMAEVDITNGTINKAYKMDYGSFGILGYEPSVQQSKIYMPCMRVGYGSSYHKACYFVLDTNGVISKQYIQSQASNGYWNSYTGTTIVDSLKSLIGTMFRYNSNSDPVYPVLFKLDSNLVGCYPSDVPYSFTTTVATGDFHSLPMSITITRDSLYEVFGTINQGHGFNTIVDECVGYVGVKEEGVIQNINFKVYPNPSTGMFYYEILEYLYEDYKLEVTNTLGELVLSSILRGDRSGAGSINLSELPNGIYFITLSTPQKQLFTSKLSVVK